jgi:hypothetical protein
LLGKKKLLSIFNVVLEKPVRVCPGKKCQQQQQQEVPAAAAGGYMYRLHM